LTIQYIIVASQFDYAQPVSFSV